jgi:hypothetical protein
VIDAGATAASAGDGLRATEADRAALTEVLSRPEFHRPEALPSALRRLLVDLWDRLVEGLGTAEAERYASLGRTIFFVAAAVACLLAWRALRRRQARPARRPGTTADQAATPAREAVGAETAVALLRRGELAGAVRSAFQAAVGAGARGEVAATLGLTGRELAERSGDGGFRELAWLHERTVFGRRPVAPDEAARAVEVAVRLCGAPGRPGQGAP